MPNKLLLLTLTSRSHLIEARSALHVTVSVKRIKIETASVGIDQLETKKMDIGGAIEGVTRTRGTLEASLREIPMARIKTAGKPVPL